LLLNAFSVQEHEISLELDNPIEQVVITLPFSTSDVIYYFVAPDEYLGNKVTAYGGKLQYTLEYTKGRSDVGTGVLAADVILIVRRKCFSVISPEKIIKIYKKRNPNNFSMFFLDLVDEH